MMQIIIGFIINNQDNGINKNTTRTQKSMKTN
jgi:hypothetical protein